MVRASDFQLSGREFDTHLLHYRSVGTEKIKIIYALHT